MRQGVYKMMHMVKPRIYLITPSNPEMHGNFPHLLNLLLEKYDIACLRLNLNSEKDHIIGKVADTLRRICQKHDVAIIIEKHILLVEKFGLDGVHLKNGAKSISKARKNLGKDAIIGSFCGVSKHSAMKAAELGADYVSFGPVDRTNINNQVVAEVKLFEWWSQIIEVPVIAEGGFDRMSANLIGQYADFIAFGEELWNSSDPVSTLEFLLGDFYNS